MHAETADDILVSVPAVSSAESVNRSEELVGSMMKIRRELLCFLYRYTRNREDAEDIFQKVALKIVQKPESYDVMRSFSAWIYPVMQHAAIDFLRSSESHMQKRTVQIVSFASTEKKDLHSHTKDLYPPEPVSRELSVESAFEVRENIALVLEKIEKLPLHTQQLVYLLIEGHRYRVIAEKLGVPLGTVKSRIHAVRAFLREMFPVTE